MNHKFTILSTTYNKGIYLEDWLKSIVSQKYRPLEVILVDDCSKDNTKTMIRRVEKKLHAADISFQYARNKKRIFCSSSYSRALQLSTGDFLGILDADDMLVKDAVKYIMSKYNQYTEVAWIYTQFQICNAKMRKLKTGFCRLPSGYDSLLASGEKRKHMYSHWRTFSRRCNDFNDLFPIGLKCAVDKYMGYKLEELGPGMFIDRICYMYRQGAKHSISLNEETKRTWRRLVKKSVKYRKDNNIKQYSIIQGK